MRYWVPYFLIISMLLFPVNIQAQFAPTAGFSGVASGSDLKGSITTVVNTFLGLVALFAAIALIRRAFYGGLASSDDRKKAAAYRDIVGILLGLVLIALSAVIVNFIIRAL